MKGGAKMGEPYRYKRKLVKIGSSYYVLAPKEWLEIQTKKLKIKRVRNVILEVYDDKLIITPMK